MREKVFAVLAGANADFRGFRRQNLQFARASVDPRPSIEGLGHIETADGGLQTARGENASF